MKAANSHPGASTNDLRRMLRSRAVAAREALDPQRHAQLSAALCGHLSLLITRLAPCRLAFCWPYRAEPDLRGLIADWLAGDAERRAGLPVVVAPDRPLVFYRWTPDTPLREDAYGIPVPAVADVIAPELVLVPLNAFDARGYRLGYGGGYFDRTLAALEPPPQTIGVGFELGRVQSILPEPHDRPMDWIVTESGVFAAD
ncbi:MAG: 5-formyltetrahydrofolate cyclo-ligase [Betaproteobacteria bacterium]|nr:5-formyltetrahydrofolate cyclo-ligase [Betaproteobacteria bacterium]